MSDGTTSEQRRYRRIPAEEPVQLYFHGDPESVTGCIVNLGPGGAYVRCTTPVEVGRQLVCAFFLKQGDLKRLVGCHGTVRWLADAEVRREVGPGFGIRFDEKRPDMVAALKTFVAQQLSL